MELECGGEEGDSVQVAVRMRVFNSREKAVNAERIVRMENLERGSKTYILDPDTREERDFKYDYSFQSHSETEPGIGEWATQDTVMSTLGMPVLNAALEGRNVSLFAYGQTGSGKSFSMLGKVGVPELEGIIPRSCKEIFRRVDAEENPLVTHTVDIQVVEVYCEMINDLLADRKAWPANGHKPRLTPKDGYVVDTTKKPCFNFDDINSAMEFADKNRSVGSHALNPESSRAHTIYQINYAKNTKDEQGRLVETVSAKLNLIDLAGSERTDSAGTTGQMLKEGNAINLSLTALGSCIKALSENRKPNFRDSKLTLLLQASMTAGKVIMIAALSPASICYAESLSTLKFADRIKQVKIKSSKNVTADPVAELKKAMEEMRERMQAEIDALRRAGAGGDGRSAAIIDLERALQEQREAEATMRTDLERKLKELQMGNKERRTVAKEIDSGWRSAFKGLSATSSANETLPHFINLNEDARLAETLVYPFVEARTLIGRQDRDDPPQLEFNGMGISKGHCLIEKDGHRVFITALNGSRTFVNGKAVTQRTELIHQNRVWLGNNYAFRFVFPGREVYGEGLEEDPDYFVAQDEMASAHSAAIREEAGGQVDLPPELNSKLAEALQKVQQATVIALDLKKPVRFAPKIFKNRFTQENDVAVYVRIGDGELYWPWQKFQSRLVQMSNLWEAWQRHEQDGEAMELLSQEDDPFLDTEHQLIGEADVWLQSLANMMELEAETSILNPLGNVEGQLSVEIRPCDRNGGIGPWDDDDELDPFVDDPEDLVGEEIKFEVHVNQILLDVNIAQGSGCKYEQTFVRYKFDINDMDEEWSQTPECASATFNPKFLSKHKHRVHIDQRTLRHILNDRMVFQVWGKLTRKSVSGTSRAVVTTKRTLDALDQEIERKRKLLECPHCAKSLVSQDGETNVLQCD